MIGFKLPAINPTTEEELEAFRELSALSTDTIGAFISNIAKVINRYMNLPSTDRLELRAKTQRLLTIPVHERVLLSYSNLLFFMTEVSLSKINYQ